MYKRISFTRTDYSTDLDFTAAVNESLQEFSDYFTTQLVTTYAYGSNAMPAIRFNTETGAYFCVKPGLTDKIHFTLYYDFTTSNTQINEYSSLAPLDYYEIYTNEETKEFYIVFNGGFPSAGVFIAENGDKFLNSYGRNYRNGIVYGCTWLYNDTLPFDSNTAILLSMVPIPQDGHLIYERMKNAFVVFTSLTLSYGDKVKIDNVKYVSFMNNSGNKKGIFRYTP